jgi:carboxypeptidase C (cathepsin A)
MRFHKILTTIAVGLFLSLAASATVHAQSTLLPGLVAGDEPIVITKHVVKTVHGPIEYEARAGRLAIRNDETGEVHAHIFFVAYVAKNHGTNRPLTFIWNGGPTTPSLILHTQAFGPRRITEQGFVDNAETLLASSDLVFYDPIETGFSRPEQPEFTKEFLTVLGDFAETAEFIRAYRARFTAEHQPLFLAGESYGSWRASGTAELLAKRGDKINGVILISGGVPGSLMPFEFTDGMSIQARTAAAFVLNKLPPDLMRDREATMKAVNDWIVSTYMPVLSHVDKLSDTEREEIAKDLARFTGIHPDQVDRKTLVVSNLDYRKGLFDGDPAKLLNTYDMRIVGPTPPNSPESSRVIADYFRVELGYSTDLAYAGLENGYMPVGGPPRRSTSSQWVYDHTPITPELMARMHSGGGPPASQPWLQNAMRMEPNMRVFVVAGRYDTLNMCEGNLAMTAKLEPDVSKRFAHHCYEGGHMMYHDEPTRLKLSEDLAKFYADDASSSSNKH